MSELQFRHEINPSTFQVRSTTRGIQVKVRVQFSWQFRKNKKTEKGGMCLSGIFS